MSTLQLSAKHTALRRVSERLFGGRAHGRETWVVCGLIAIAAAIRIVTLDNQSLWADEALTSYEVRQSFGGMLHLVASVETTPPLYFVAVWIWAKLFGTGAVALRSLSALAGVALVPIAHQCGRELCSRRAGVLAAAFVVVNPFMIWYSQEARAYMLLAALTGASFLFFARALRDPSRANLGWWAGLSSAAVMTHFFAGFAIAPEALWLLWSARSRANAVAVAVVAAVQVAMIPFAVAGAAPARGAGWIAAIPRINRIGQTVVEWGASNLYRRVGPDQGVAAGAAIALIVAALLVLGGDRRARRTAAIAGGVAAVVFLAPLTLGLVGQDYFLSRNEIPAFVPVVTVLAAACASPRARVAGSVLAIALLGLFCFTSIDVQTHPFLQRPDWRAVAAALGPASMPRAILAADGTTADPLKIYLPGARWTEPANSRVPVSEIDVVGARKRLALRPGPLRSPSSAVGASALDGGAQGVTGSPVPARRAPRGARLLARFRVHNWIVARFALGHPERLSIADLSRLASRFFRRVPAKLLIFVQQAAG
ncbi:MAG: glycosyltransferase family 39 protein [Solirubrobacteraceae bacterium]